MAALTAELTDTTWKEEGQCVCVWEGSLFQRYGVKPRQRRKIAMRLSNEDIRKDSGLK
jgi:hypothetical protein